jgi:hypothetical protein
MSGYAAKTTHQLMWVRSSAAVSLRTFVSCAILVFLVLLEFSSSNAEAQSRSYADLNGKVSDPLDPGQKLASVLIFFGQECPISNAYVPEINRLYATFTNFAFYVVQVDPELTTTAARRHAESYDLHPPVILDPTHELVHLAGASVTPEAVVFGKASQVIYRGRIDDLFPTLGKKRSSPTQRDLANALAALSEGRAIRMSETRAIGCVIESSETRKPVDTPRRAAVSNQPHS